MTSSLADRAIRIQAGLGMRDRDPLRFHKWGVERHKPAFALFADPVQPISELHLRSCNKGTKTSIVAKYVCGCAQKRETLDGVPLPKWRGPVECAQLVLDYKQQLLSVQPAYVRALGQWPHHITRKGSTIESIEVMPINGSDDRSTWSKIHFLSQKNVTTGTGVRADIVAFDEPPVMPILEELRKAAHAGRRGIRIIAETPILRRQWQPLKEQYGDCPRRTLQRVGKLWAECRWSLDEVADWILSPEEKEDLLIEYGRDRDHKSPLYDARVHGDYIDASGSCPFDIPTLLKMMEDSDYCLEPEDEVEWPIQREGSDDGRPFEVRLHPVRFFAKAKPGASYRCTIDPSAGIDDNKHDPFYAEWSEIGSGDVVAETEGYLPGSLVGILCAGISRRFYNDALVDFEVNDRWGVNVLEGLNLARYGNIATEPRELNGTWSKEPGFHNNAQTRPLIIGAVQDVVEDYRAGIRYGRMPRRTIECLLDCILDEAGKIVAAPGLHDERLICRGQALRTGVTRSNRRVPAAPELAKTARQRTMARMRGEDSQSDAPFGQVALVPRRRPR